MIRISESSKIVMNVLRTHVAELENSSNFQAECIRNKNAEIEELKLYIIQEREKLQVLCFTPSEGELEKAWKNIPPKSEPPLSPKHGELMDLNMELKQDLKKRHIQVGELDGALKKKNHHLRQLQKKVKGLEAELHGMNRSVGEFEMNLDNRGRGTACVRLLDGSKYSIKIKNVVVEESK